MVHQLEQTDLTVGHLVDVNCVPLRNHMYHANVPAGLLRRTSRNSSFMLCRAAQAQHRYSMYMGHDWRTVHCATLPRFTFIYRVWFSLCSISLYSITPEFFNLFTANRFNKKVTVILKLEHSYRCFKGQIFNLGMKLDSLTQCGEFLASTHSVLDLNIVSTCIALCLQTLPCTER